MNDLESFALVTLLYSSGVNTPFPKMKVAHMEPMALALLIHCYYEEKK